VGIIGVVIALLIPAVQRAREAANRVRCANNLKQFGLAIQQYHDSNGVLPPTRTRGDGGISWAVIILPFLEQNNFYAEWDPLANYADQPAGTAAQQQAVALFFCPSRRKPPSNSFQNGPIPPSWPPGPQPPGYFSPPNPPWPPQTWPLGPPGPGWPPWPPPGTLGGVNGEAVPGAVADYAVVAGDDPTPADAFDVGCPTAGSGPGCHSPSGTCYNSECANGAMVVARWTPDPNHPARLLDWSSRTSFASITDGLSTTLLIGEKQVPFGDFGSNWVPPDPYWTANPPDNPADGAIYNGQYPWVVSRIAGIQNPLAQTPNEAPQSNFGSAHPGICQFVLADGSVRALPVTIDPLVLGRLASRNDGKPLPEF
jgi:hypothetical protein